MLWFKVPPKVYFKRGATDLALRVLKDNDKPSICLINARSGRSYFGVYEQDKIIVSDTIKSNEEVLSYIKEHPSYSICGSVSYLGYENLDTNIC